MGQKTHPTGFRLGISKTWSSKWFNAKGFHENLEEDLEFARRTEEAFKRYEKGEFIEMDFDEFLKEAKKW